MKKILLIKIKNEAQHIKVMQVFQQMEYVSKMGRNPTERDYCPNTRCEGTYVEFKNKFTQRGNSCTEGFGIEPHHVVISCGLFMRLYGKISRAAINLNTYTKDSAISGKTICNN